MLKEYQMFYEFQVLASLFFQNCPASGKQLENASLRRMTSGHTRLQEQSSSCSKYDGYTRPRYQGSLTIAIASVLATLSVGCASPGPPRPPSLKLPSPVSDLTAVRV